MSKSIALAILACMLLEMACATLTLPPAGFGSPPTGNDVAPTHPAATLAAESIVAIPLHVGRGVRGSWFELYFTDPASRASGQSTGGVDGQLVDAIDRARLSVHAAIYNLSLNNVRDALIRAHRRGVGVRLVTESDNLDGEDLQRLVEAGIPVLGDGRESTMHNKFMVIDRGEVWTGSMNFTVSGVYQDNNDVIRITSAELVSDFEAEFAEMFEDDTYGTAAGRITPHPRVELGGSLLQAYFAPDDDVEPALVNLLATARESVLFLAYSFTSDPLGEAVRHAAEARIKVRGVMDEDQASSNIGGELTAFRAAGLDVRLDRNPGQMHEKVMIIDNEVVVLGSYNFSRNASESNDENVLVIHSRPIAGQFVREFERIYALAYP